MPAPIMAPAAALAEPVVWNEDPQRQGWWKRILAATPPESPTQRKNFNPDKDQTVFAEYGHPTNELKPSVRPPRRTEGIYRCSTHVQLDEAFRPNRRAITCSRSGTARNGRSRTKHSHNKDEARRHLPTVDSYG